MRQDAKKPVGEVEEWTKDDSRTSAIQGEHLDPFEAHRWCTCNRIRKSSWLLKEKKEKKEKPMMNNNVININNYHY